MSTACETLPIHDPRQAGFTLVELLVAVTLLSLLSLVLMNGLRLGVHAWQRTATHSESVDHSLLAQNFLRRVIEDAYPYLPSDDAARSRVAFDGARESLRLLASAPAALGGSGRSRIELSLGKRDGRVDLMVTSSSELADGAAAPTRKVLLADVSSVEFAYFGKRRSDRSVAWHDDWANESGLPQLVRIRVRSPTSDARIWPELLIAPRIAVDVGCVHDPLTKGCRGR